MLKIVSRELLEELSQRAKISPRKRLNHNFHDDLADPINRMLNALEPGTYIRRTNTKTLINVRFSSFYAEVWWLFFLTIQEKS